MSKSRGNIVRAEPIQQVMGADALRYFLLREIVFGQDGSFSYDALIGRYNSDLANGLGNLASRTLTMINQYRGGVIPAGDGRRHRRCWPRKTIADVTTAFDAFEFSSGLEADLGADLRGGQIHRGARALEAGAADRKRRRELDDTLYTAAEALRIVTALLSPVLPESAPKIWAQLGMPEPSNRCASTRSPGANCQPARRSAKYRGVFPRIELKEAIAKMRELEAEGHRRAERAAGQSSPSPAQPTAAPASERIAIDDFVKVDLRVGLVLSAEPVKGADKLLHLKVDIGEPQPRTIVAGIAEAYPAGAVDRPQSGDRRQSAAAQAERHRIERHDRGGVGRRRQAGAGRLPGRHSRRGAPEVKLIDSHCHLDDKQFDADREQVIERALRGRRGAHDGHRHRRRSAGSGSRACAWPTSIRSSTPRSACIRTMPPRPRRKPSRAARRWPQHPKVLAIGEIGLDYHYDFSPRDVQRDVFVAAVEAGGAGPGSPS